MRIKQQSPAALVPNPDNVKIHTDKQIDKIVKLIAEFGFTNPVLVDENNVIIAGHGRTEAALKSDLKKIPTIMLEGLTDEQKMALALADNQVGTVGVSWDEEKLDMQLEKLDKYGFDVEDLGFKMPALDEVDDDYDDDGIKYQESFAVVVQCDDEIHQEHIFKKLQGEGYNCKVLVN